MSERSPPRSAPKLACLALQRDLLARAAAVPGGLSGAGVEASGHEGSELIGEEEAARWLSPLPKMLWDLGAGVCLPPSFLTSPLTPSPPVAFALLSPVSSCPSALSGFDCGCNSNPSSCPTIS